MGTVNIKTKEQIDQENYESWPSRIAAKRYDEETKGLTFTLPSTSNTVTVSTDRQSQGLVTGAVMQAEKASSGWTKQWKTRDGFVNMTANDIIEMGDVIANHVQMVFDREAELIEKWKDKTITESDLNSGWSQ